MGTLEFKYPLVKLPSEVQLPIYLIKEELKSRKFFNTLQQMGLDDCYFQPHLDTLILRSLDMDDDSDKTFDAYCEIMERRSKKIDTDKDSIMKQALKAYHELLDQKKEINASKKGTKIS
jgi:glutamine synthetase